MMPAERLREEYSRQAHIDQLADHRRIAAVAGQMDNEQAIGTLGFLGDRGHIGRRHHVAAQELNITEFLLQFGEVLVELFDDT
ncbi:MAG: hypothetical protein JW829_20645 [Pirellulales bacterium]|nr:hypothetical protein [Pirellulales bacterium]